MGEIDFCFHFDGRVSESSTGLRSSVPFCRFGPLVLAIESKCVGSNRHSIQYPVRVGGGGGEEEKRERHAYRERMSEWRSVIEVLCPF